MKTGILYINDYKFKTRETERQKIKYLTINFGRCMQIQSNNGKW